MTGIQIIIYILVGMAAWGLIKWLYDRLMSKGEVEFSSKSGSLEPRYIKHFKKIPLDLPPDTRKYFPNIDIEKKSKELLNILNECAEYSKQFHWWPMIEGENILMYFSEFGNLRFTLKMDRGNYRMSEGYDESKEPTLVIPMHEQNLKNLRDILKDGKLTYEEQYRIYAVVAPAALQALYRNNGFYLGYDLRPLKFDNLIHVDIPPEQPVYLLGLPAHVKLTVANVDGYWIVASGHQGDPDFKITLNLDQATQLYRMGLYEVREVVGDKTKALPLSKKFLKFLKEVTTYTRSDHKS